LALISTYGSPWSIEKEGVFSSLLSLFLNRHDRTQKERLEEEESSEESPGSPIDFTIKDKRKRYQLGLIEIKLA
jgi:hypothetical protein